jgi:hypothetical protein
MSFWKNKRFITLASIMLGVVIAVIGMFIWLGNDRSIQKNPISQDIARQVDFPLYYPASLPAEFKFEEITYDTGARAVIYNYVSGDKRLLFTLQKKSDSINYNRLRDTQMTEVKEITVPTGQAVMGILEKQLISTVFTGNTLIFINATGTSTPQDLEIATRSLTKSE